MPYADLLILAQSGDAEAAAAAGIIGVVIVCFLLYMALVLATTIATIAGLWKIFEKAGKPGWAAIVPIYNIYVLHEIAGLEIIWFILCLIPVANIVGIIVIWIEVAKCFGKDAGYAIGLALLPFIFAPMLGFGKAQYQPPLQRPHPMGF